MIQLYKYATDDYDESHNGDHSKHFSYEKPDDWLDEYPVCAGVRQSPINIELQDVETMDTWRPALGRIGYDTKPLEMSITNNGHSGMYNINEIYIRLG